MENYYKEFQKTISSLNGTKPSLLLHVCCAPCLSGVIDRLLDNFNITIYFYNPNINTQEEYSKRLYALQTFIKARSLPVKLIAENYNNSEYESGIAGLETEKEGSRKCYNCYNLRLLKTAKTAKERDFNYFCTVLSVSPYKNANWINETGLALQEQIGVNYLVNDFKKDNGYLLSCNESKKYGLYRQSYCGCNGSLAELKIKERN